MSAPTKTFDVKTATQPATEDVCGAEAAATSDTVCKHPGFGAQSQSAFETALEAAAYSIDHTVYNRAALKDLRKDLSNRFDTVVKDSGLSEREFDDKTHEVKWLVNVRSQANFMETDSFTQKTMLNFKTTIKASIVDKAKGEHLDSDYEEVVMHPAIPARMLSYEEITEMNLRSVCGKALQACPEEVAEDLTGRALKQLLEDQSCVEGLLNAEIADIPHELRSFDPVIDVDYNDNDLNIYCVCDVYRLDKASHRTSVLPQSAEICFSVKKTSNGEWGVFNHTIEAADTEVTSGSGGEEEEEEA